MKKFSFRLIVIISFIVMLCESCSQNGNEKTSGEKQKNITYTTLDVKNEYEIIRIITGCSDASASLSKDDILKAYSAAWANLATEAYNQKADAVVGIRATFITFESNAIVIVYGTAVKYK
jgi:hypothetical protein